ncbi:MAG: glucosyltransferase domain-containing protein [Gammaproteobacteria bacterium]|nr:glucosyltransferase domain-containing protein [Gammaproteobacteria bacterium]
MNSLYSKSLDQVLTEWWNSIDHSCRKAFFFVAGVNLLAFGFEMTNLTLHHDDLFQIFIQDDILGHYLGRFGVGKLHYYGQNGYFMPFLQMLTGIVLMSMYGIIIAHLWGARKTMDMVLIASIVCVFPYMAQVYQYNTSMATYSMAHLLSAMAVFLSTRATLVHVATASILYMFAFSIYQSVIANAATIFVFYAIARLLFSEEGHKFVSKAMVKSTLAALLAVVTGGIIYLAIVSFMGISFDSTHAADKAFSLGDGINLSYAASEIAQGTRSFFFWPENYFPDYLKKLQLLLLAGAGVICLWLPRSPGGKIGAIAMLVVASLCPRLLQILHPEGVYHNLTLTAYGVVIAGAIMIINRAAHTAIRNLSIILSFILISGYVMQCNWISTVNYLNTLAHYSTLTQVLARIRSLPGDGWDGKDIVVVGKYKMSPNYPFKSATGVAVSFMDAIHMQHLANLMRDDVSFTEADNATPGALEYAAMNPSWPHPASVGVIDGTGVVVFSKTAEVAD